MENKRLLEVLEMVLKYHLKDVALCIKYNVSQYGLCKIVGTVVYSLVEMNFFKQGMYKRASLPNNFIEGANYIWSREKTNTERREFLEKWIDEVKKEIEKEEKK